MTQPTASKRARLLTAIACVAGAGGVVTVAAALLGAGAPRGAHAASDLAGERGRLFEPAPDEGDETGAIPGGATRFGTRRNGQTAAEARHAGSSVDRLGDSFAPRKGEPGFEEGGAAEGHRRSVSLQNSQARARHRITGELLVGEAALGPDAVPVAHEKATSDADSVTKANVNGSCGDNVVQADECEPPGTPLCSDDCIPVSDLACFDCEQSTDCWEFAESCLQPGFGPIQQSLCFDVQECVKASHCADGGNPLTACFCGNLSTADCIAAPHFGPKSPAGACADVIRTGMGGEEVSNGEVLTRYINMAFAGGAGLARMNCQKLAPVCTAVCGF